MSSNHLKLTILLLLILLLTFAVDQLLAAAKHPESQMKPSNSGKKLEPSKSGKKLEPSNSSNPRKLIPQIPLEATEDERDMMMGLKGKRDGHKASAAGLVGKVPLPSTAGQSNNHPSAGARPNPSAAAGSPHHDGHPQVVTAKRTPPHPPTGGWVPAPAAAAHQHSAGSPPTESSVGKEFTGKGGQVPAAPSSKVGVPAQPLPQQQEPAQQPALFAKRSNFKLPTELPAQPAVKVDRTKAVFRLRTTVPKPEVVQRFLTIQMWPKPAEKGQLLFKPNIYDWQAAPTGMTAEGRFLVDLTEYLNKSSWNALDHFNAQLAYGPGCVLVHHEESQMEKPHAQKCQVFDVKHIVLGKVVSLDVRTGEYSVQSVAETMLVRQLDNKPLDEVLQSARANIESAIDAHIKQELKYTHAYFLDKVGELLGYSNDAPQKKALEQGYKRVQADFKKLEEQINAADAVHESFQGIQAQLNGLEAKTWKLSESSHKIGNEIGELKKEQQQMIGHIATQVFDNSNVEFKKQTAAASKLLEAVNAAKKGAATLSTEESNAFGSLAAVANKATDAIVGLEDRVGDEEASVDSAVALANAELGKLRKSMGEMSEELKENGKKLEASFTRFVGIPEKDVAVKDAGETTLNGLMAFLAQGLAKVFHYNIHQMQM